MFVVFEGLDNCGKTTIVKMLGNYFKNKGMQVDYTHEFETSVGILIRELEERGELDPILKSYLFAADRQIRTRDYTNDDYSNKIIMFDRYFLSAVAYRMADGVDKEWIKSINSVFRSPDITFYIDISPEESILRNTTTKFNISYTRDYLNRAREAYLSMIGEYGMIYIDGMRTIKEIYNQVLKYIEESLENGRFKNNSEESISQ